MLSIRLILRVSEAFLSYSQRLNYIHTDKANKTIEITKRDIDEAQTTRKRAKTAGQTQKQQPLKN